VSRSGCTGRFILVPGTGAGCFFFLPLGREHVVIHRDHHGDEHDRVVEEMKLDPRKKKLEDAARFRLMPEIVVRHRLPDQQEVLDVMPELDPERDHPPGMRDAGEPFSEYPETDQHDQRVTVVQNLSLDQPRIKQSKQTQRLGTRPPHDVDLIGLD